MRETIGIVTLAFSVGGSRGGSHRFHQRQAKPRTSWTRGARVPGEPKSGASELIAQADSSGRHGGWGGADARARRSRVSN